MAVQKITIEQFLELATQLPVLDVRSPGEFEHAHIPGAYNLPLFTDEERKITGTAYKQESREAAIKIGLDYFGSKMRKMVETTEHLVSSRNKRAAGIEPGFQKALLVHCWRGGMRSAGVAWLLDLYGFKVYALVGGYKSYRQWVRSQFEKSYNFTVLGGYTGSGKTLVIRELKKLGMPVIDLEKLAGHKGSAFGALGEKVQPTQEMFENLLAGELSVAGRQSSALQEDGENTTDHSVYIEDESQRIGLLNIPGALWKTMRDSKLCFIDIPFERRLDYLVEEYGKFNKESLVNAIIRIQKRLGGQETKTAINYLLENNSAACFRILVKYYDKCYEKAMQNKESLQSTLNKVTCPAVDVKNIIDALIHERAIAL